MTEPTINELLTTIIDNIEELKSEMEDLTYDMRVLKDTDTVDEIKGIVDEIQDEVREIKQKLESYDAEDVETEDTLKEIDSNNVPHTIDEVNEDNAGGYSICRHCKKIIHIAEKQFRNNYVSLILGNWSDSTIVSECYECRYKSEKAESLVRNQRRLKQMKLYLLDSSVTEQDILVNKDQINNK